MIGCAAVALMYGQRPMSPERITALRALSADLHQRHLAERRQVVRLAAAAGIPVRRVLPDGRTAEMQRFIDGRPLCYITTNLNAALTVSTDLVWPDGGMGLDLTGSGITAGIWDDGGVLTSHQEFGGRVSLADGSTTSSDHATHVAGTMIASGVFEPMAQGMASEAVLQSYDWNDDGAEMAAAAAGGLSLSNHSYCFITGWEKDYFGDGRWAWFGNDSVSTVEDYRFGFYDSTASDWDSIAVNAPTYLIVAAAGNDRWDDGPSYTTEQYWWWNPASAKYDKWEKTTLTPHPRSPDGDYDCLPGGPQVAKNVLVVGAVDDIPGGYTDQSDVVMTPFSSWGPTDDGRLKPDLVANGMEVYSTLASGNAAYGPLSGTSMAAASVTGSVALLQQHYRQTHNGDLPLAATLRALLIHTADEAGTAPGPDYAFGWGLLNTAAAAELISRDAGGQWIIQELTLNEGESYSTTVTSDGPDPLKVTIAWTDPPATPLSPALNDITARLINDLDLLITRDDVELFYPWLLDVTSPKLDATQADNNVDNVEQVLVPTLGPGEYTITVSHKSALLTGTQDFSMVITGASMPQVLVWEGDSTEVDYSGIFLRDTLPVAGDVEVTYTTIFPESLSGFDAVFLSFGNLGDAIDRTPFDNRMAVVVQEYLEGGGSLYLEGGDALGEDLVGDNTDTLHSLLGIESVVGGYNNSIDSLVGQTSTITDGMLFTASTQKYSQYIDRYTPGTGAAAFVESNYGTVAVQNTGSYGQRTFVFSYALAGLVDGASSPSTKSDLLAALLDFFLEEPPPPPNNPPQITSLDTAKATVDVLFVYRATATDPDGDPVTFTFDSLSTWLSVVGPDSVAGIPGEGITGGSFRVIASDSQLNDTLEVTITVNSVNDAPIAVNDTVRTSEDKVVTLAALVNDRDPDGDEFYLADTTWLAHHGQVSIIIIDKVGPAGIIFIYIPDTNFFGGDSFSYSVTDGVLFDTALVLITVTPVNDPPESFALLGPGSDDTTTVVITTENISNTLTFSWQSAEDVDGDSVWYCFDATGTLTAIFPSGDTSATELNLAYSDLVPLIREAGESGRVTGTWTIIATDGTSTTRAANGPFGLTLDISRLGLDGQDDIPKEFALRQNYPNPFNPSTTLRFALPRTVEVRLVVVDLLGREIARLVDGHLPAGYHQVTWNGKTHWGKEAPSGMYIVRMFIPPTAGAAPGFVHQIKMVLLR